MAPSEIADENVPATSQDISSQPIPANWRHKRCTFFGRRLSVVSLDGGETFLIGVQIAALLKRETFNMYRSMKIKNVNIQRATPLQVEFLAKCSAVRTGTHSVTLIPHTEGLYFIADAWSRQHKGDIFPFLQRGKGLRNFLVERPQLHRRKPCPWDVHRAIKKTELARCPSNTADFMSTIAVSKTSATPLEGSPAASPSYHTPLSASLSSLTSSHHSDFESDSEASDMETGLATKSTPASAADNAVHSLAALCHRSPILPTPYPANSANSGLSVPCQMYSFDNLQPNFFHNFANQQFSYCS